MLTTYVSEQLQLLETLTFTEPKPTSLPGPLGALQKKFTPRSFPPDSSLEMVGSEDRQTWLRQTQASYSPSLFLSVLSL